MNPARPNKSPIHPPLLAGIEAGGTKYVCSVAVDPRAPLLEVRFPTRAPKETMEEAAAFFSRAVELHGPISALGIGTFGPAELDTQSPEFGSILTTPKLGWGGFNVVNAMRRSVGESVPIAFDTDVNAAAIAESQFGAGQGHRFVAYVTIGTGIGAAFIHDGNLLHGRMHPEVGHIQLPDFDSAIGKDTNHCDFHSSCFEGRASGPAIEARWGVPPHDLPDIHEAWELQASYLAAGCITLTAVWSPDIIILGGGVSQKPGLIDRVRRQFREQSGGYWKLPPLESYLQTPSLDQQAGIVGALTMAQRLIA